MRTLLIRAGLIAGLFLQGMVLGLLCLLLTAPQSKAADERAQVPLEIPEADSMLAVYPPQQHRQKAEQLLLGGDPYQALPHYLNAAPDKLLSADENLLFRIALCYEASRDFDRSARLYRTILDQANEHWLSVAAKIGLARCHLQRRNMPAARRLIWPDYLVSGTGGLGPYSLDAVQILSQSFVSQMGRDESELLNNDLVLAIPNHAIRADLELKKLIEVQASQVNGAEMSNDRGPEENRIEISNVVRSGAAADDLFLDFYSQRASLVLVLQRLSNQFGIPINITAEAEKTVQSHRITVNLSGIDFGSVLDGFTLPFELHWQKTDDNSILIMTRKQASGQMLLVREKQAAFRLIERALITVPENSNVDFIQMIMAELHHQLGEPERAIAIYSELLAGRIDSRMRRAANFNVGKVSLFIGDRDHALDAFTRVTDSNEVGSIQTISYLMLGQINLESGNIDDAVSAFMRARRISENSLLTQMAVSGLAATYLLDHQPRSAKRVVFADRTQFTTPVIRDYASLIASLADAESSAAELGENERLELLSAVTNVESTPDLGPQSQLIIARGYDFLGFTDQSIDSMFQSLEMPMGPWLRGRLFDELATRLADAGRQTELRQLLFEAMHDPNSSDPVTFAIHLANLEFEKKNHDSCLEICRQILAMSDDPAAHSGALNLMGRIYQLNGQHHHAALCFAGLLPNESDTPEGDSSEH